MRRILTVFASLVLCLACASAVARADNAKAMTTQLTGIATGGTLTRTIIDVSEPNGPGDLSPEQAQVTHNVSCNVPAGKTAAQMAVMLRDSIMVQVGGFGYTALLIGDGTRVQMNKPGGSFQLSGPDGNTTGITHANVFLLPAVSGTGLGVLALLLLSLVAFWRRPRTAT
jgi:hypothetical protein